MAQSRGQQRRAREQREASETLERRAPLARRGNLGAVTAALKEMHMELYQHEQARKEQERLQRIEERRREREERSRAKLAAWLETQAAEAAATAAAGKPPDSLAN